MWLLILAWPLSVLASTLNWKVQKKLNSISHFKVDARTDKDHAKISSHIYDCFSHLKCFLLPHPGKKVAKKDFTGQLKQIDEDFQEQLLSLVPSLLSPENLVVKRINGERVTCGELCEYFKTYTQIFGDGNLPEPTSIFEATAEANNLNAFNKGMQFFKDEMNKVSRMRL